MLRAWFSGLGLTARFAGASHPMRVLVTAGNTREKIDDVRDWGNIFTGNTGLSIARALAEIAHVDLLASNRQHIEQLSAELSDGKHTTQHPIAASSFTSHAELKGALAALMARNTYDAVFMTAAVADYTPERVFAVLERRPDDDPDGTPGRERWIVQDIQAAKVKSTHEHIAILGRQTEKLVDLFRSAWKHTGLLVKFKLEVGISKDDLIRIGQQSRKQSHADYLVANTLDMVQGESPGAFLLSDEGEEWVPRAELPARMRSVVGSRST